IPAPLLRDPSSRSMSVLSRSGSSATTSEAQADELAREHTANTAAAVPATLRNGNREPANGPATASASRRAEQYTVWPIATREFMESVPRSVRRTPAPGVLVLAARGALPLREYSPSLHAVHSPSGSTRPRCTRRTPAPGVLVLAARAALPLRGYSPSLHAMRARSGSTPATRCTHCTP